MQNINRKTCSTVAPSESGKKRSEVMCVCVCVCVLCLCVCVCVCMYVFLLSMLHYCVVILNAVNKHVSFI